MAKAIAYDRVISEHPVIMAWGLRETQTHSLGRDGSLYWMDAWGALYLCVDGKLTNKIARIHLDGNLELYDLTRFGQLVRFHLRYEGGKLVEIKDNVAKEKEEEDDD